MFLSNFACICNGPYITVTLNPSNNGIKLSWQFLTIFKYFAIFRPWCLGTKGVPQLPEN